MVLRAKTDDQRLLAVLAAQQSVEELRDAFRQAMRVVDAATSLRDAYGASLTALDPLATGSVLEDVESAEVALLVAVERFGKRADKDRASRDLVDSAL